MLTRVSGWESAIFWLNGGKSGLKHQDERIFEFLNIQKAVRLWVDETLDIKIDEDLLKALNNGIVLCYLMKAIDPNSIPTIQENTKQVFKLKENISFFLTAVEEYGVPKHQLFLVQDLWERKNIVNVVLCLAALAQKAEEKGFKPTLKPIKDDPTRRPKLDPHEMETLRVQLAKLRAKPTGNRRVKESANIARLKISLIAGNKVDFALLEKRWAKIQALARGWLARKAYQKRVRDQAYRTKVAQEILKTEAVYTSSLKVCIDSYLRPLEDSLQKKPLISREQIKKLFSDIEIIHSFNAKLKEELETRVKNWSPSQCLGDIFKKIVGFLKVYTNYVQNYGNAIATLEELKKNKHFASWLEQTRQKEGVNLDLGSFLIMPVQRVPRYNLLLEELVKHTWKDHRDYDDLVDAKNQVQEVTTYLNERKREAENMQKLLQIQASIVGNCPTIAVPSRHFVQQFSVHSKRDELTIYLFNDWVILAKTEGKKEKPVIKYKNDFYINEVDIVNDPNNPTTFEFVKGKSVIATLSTKSAQERQQLIDAYRREKNTLEQIKQEKIKVLQQHTLDDKGLSPEERLRRREEEKRKIKEQLKQAKSASPNDPQSYRDFVHKRVESLTHMKLLIQQQIEDANELKTKNTNIPTADLISQLEKVNMKIEALRNELSPDELKHLQEYEKELLLQRTNNEKNSQNEHQNAHNDQRKDKKDNRKNKEKTKEIRKSGKQKRAPPFLGKNKNTQSDNRNSSSPTTPDKNNSSSSHTPQSESKSKDDKKENVSSRKESK